ncbi:MAG TPA: 2-oxo-4-hydroxy-4-carboxy-5-ureidoimidazoline decarboxylase [Gaiellaceae bacterium]|nr:2-oxo-4-hydroxy-4-carboxy-5-ureidoimidazoline decarboxylase [Gaiellaceae bacterium]
MHDLPRKLSVGELTELFEGPTGFVRALAEREDPLGQARAVLEELPESERVEALGAHPRIGERPPSGHSAREQGSEEDPEVLAELARLNREYEERFGFRFVVFVDGRPRSAIVPVMRERLARSREEELATGCDDLVAIAKDRWHSR